jgi:hypothetical protein
LLEEVMTNDIFRALADTYYLATTLRVPSRAAAKPREMPGEAPAEAPAEVRQAAHPLLAELLDLDVIRRFRARPQGCG